MGQVDRPADARVVGRVFRQRDNNASLAQIGFNQGWTLWSFAGVTGGIADIHRRMRPCGLGEIFDCNCDFLIALDEQNVTGLERAFERFGIGRRKGPVAAGFLLQDPGEPVTDAIEGIIDKRHAVPANQVWTRRSHSKF